MEASITERRFTLERVQHRATKYILNNYELPYKVQLERLHLLSLLYTYELDDLILFVKSLKAPTDHFNIRRHIQFARNPTRSGVSSKLIQVRGLQPSHYHFYFNRSRIVRLWNHLPEIDTSLFLFTQSKIKQLLIYGIILLPASTLTPFALTMSSAPATAAQDNLSQLTFSDSLTPDPNLFYFKLFST